MCHQFLNKSVVLLCFFKNLVNWFDWQHLLNLSVEVLCAVAPLDGGRELAECSSASFAEGPNTLGSSSHCSADCKWSILNIRVIASQSLQVLISDCEHSQYER